MVAIGLLALGATLLLWFHYMQPGLPVLLFELGARPDVVPGRIDSTTVTATGRGPATFYATITYRSTTTEVITNRTPVFLKLRRGEQVEVKVVAGRPVAIHTTDGDLLFDDALAWDLAAPATALVGALLIALGFHFRRDVGGWWPQIDGRYVDPTRFDPGINSGLAVAAGLVAAAVAIGFWNGVTGSSPSPVFAPVLAVTAIGGALAWVRRTVRSLEGS
ncbi:MAG TPA: hypothetical protein VF160_10235 [Candidatus Dormibacteraeota bacterium]